MNVVTGLRTKAWQLDGRGGATHDLPHLEQTLQHFWDSGHSKSEVHSGVQDGTTTSRESKFGGGAHGYTGHSPGSEDNTRDFKHT